MLSFDPSNPAQMLAAPESRPAAFAGDSDSITSFDQQRLAAFFNDVHTIASSLLRIADYVDPPPADIVGTPYVAQKLGCTTAWVTELIKTSAIPKSCIVEGTGNGKVWKFHRRTIDEWISNR